MKERRPRRTHAATRNSRALVTIGFTSAALGLFGCSSSEETKPKTEYEGDDGTFPKDTTVDGLESFLASGAYKEAPWVFDAAPRAAEGSHLQKVRVYFNPIAADAISSGKESSPAAGAMVIKELYDSADNQVGVAVSLQPSLSPKSTTWIHYCKGPESNCQLGAGTSQSEAFYDTGMNECSTCHGGTLYAKLP